MVRDLDATSDTRINHPYAHGSSMMLVTCQEVMHVFKVFGHNFLDLDWVKLKIEMFWVLFFYGLVMFLVRD